MRPSFAGLSGYDLKELFSRSTISTPCYIIDEARLKANGERLAAIRRAAGYKILLAQKAFSNYDLYPALAPYLDGTEASGLYEARLGREEMPQKEVHVFCGAYQPRDFPEIFDYAGHIVFNSVHQLAKYGSAAKAAGKSIGLRINPRCSTQEGHAIYDPCAPGSRLGTPRSAWDAEMTPELLSILDGLHSHTLCQQNSPDLAETVKAIEEQFGDILPRLKWLNLGGGHHITRPGYDDETLIQTIRYLKGKYGFTVYLEPGEACALNAGYLVTEVMDVLGENSFPSEEGSAARRAGCQTITPAIVDVSAACHLPDIIEMPYRPPLLDAVSLEPAIAEPETFGGAPAEAAKNIPAPPFAYRLGGPTCLAGDVIGDYGFRQPLKAGDRLVFGNMAIYTTCKNNTFNGMPLPAIYKLSEGGSLTLLKSFGYSDFKSRLGKVARESDMNNTQWCKLEIFTPASHLDAVKAALREADAGHIGNYDSCLACSTVRSIWRPLAGANPYTGTPGAVSEEEEIKVEVNVKRDALNDTVAAIRRVHPYEEPLINVIPLYTA